MKARLFPLLSMLWLFCCVPLVAHAYDTWDGTRGVLKIPKVKVDRNVYSDVEVTIKEVISVGKAPEANAHDWYDIERGMLHIGKVKVGETFFFNVVVTLNEVKAVGQFGKLQAIDSRFSDVPYLGSVSADLMRAVCKQPQYSYPEANLLIPIDLNQDKRMDFVMVYFCNTMPFGSVNDDPDGTGHLFAFLSQPDGTVRLANESVFGKSMVPLKGAAEEYSIADLNGDGYLDIAFALHKEDGRKVFLNPGIGSNQGARPAVMLSDSNGRYRLEFLGRSNWNHGVGVSEQADGSKDVIFYAFHASPPIQAFRWINNQFVDITNHYPASLLNDGFLALPDVSLAKRQRFLTNTRSGQWGVDLVTSTEGEWIRSASLYYESKTAPFESWQGLKADVPVVKIGETWYVGASLSIPCLIRLRPTDPLPLALIAVHGLQIPPDWDGSSRLIENQLIVQSASFLFLSYQDDQLAPVNIPVIGKVTQDLQHQCFDINGDGYDDVLFSDSMKRGVPTVLLNNRNGGFEVEQAVYPSVSSSGPTARSTFADIDGDSVLDLIVFRTGWRPDLQDPSFIIYKGLRRSLN